MLRDNSNNTTSNMDDDLLVTSILVGMCMPENIPEGIDAMLITSQLSYNTTDIVEIVIRPASALASIFTGLDVVAQYDNDYISYHMVFEEFEKQVEILNGGILAIVMEQGVINNLTKKEK